MSEENLNEKIDLRIRRFYEDKNIKNCFNGIKKDLKLSVKSFNDKVKAIEKQDSPAFKPFYNRFYKLIKEEIGNE